MRDHSSTTTLIRHIFSYVFILIIIFIASIHSKGALCSTQTQISISPLSNKIQQPTITALLRDHHGFLWIGTQHGLYKFDGVNLSKFSSEAKGENWIPASYIKQIIEDSNDQILVATFGGGILIWDLVTQTFKKIKGSTPSDISYVNELVRSSSGKIWAGGRDGLFWHDNSNVSANTRSFIKYNQNDEQGEVSAVTSDETGFIYVAYGLNLYRISENLNSYTKLIWQDPLEKVNDRITALALDQDNNIYIGTDGGDLISYNLFNETINSQIALKDETKNSIISMIYYNDFLWIGTSNGVSYTDSSFSFFKYFSQDNSELSNSHVTSLLGDEKIIWVGTYQGLNSISFVPFDNFNEQNSGVFNDVLAFEEDIDHNLWVGTFDGLYVYNEERKFHINFADIPGSGDLNDHRIMTISAKANELWLGFRRDGVQIVNTKSFHVTTPPIPALKQLEVTKIIHTERGQTWLATFNHGLYRIEGEKIYSYMPNGLPEESVTILLSKKTGGILAASEHNIYEYDEATDSFYPLKFDFGTGGGDPFVLSLSQSKNDDIWIGTKDRGLFIWRHREQKIKSLKLEHVSIDRDHSLTTVYEIQFDSEGHAWCSTQSGVLKLDLAGKTLARFSSSDGLQGSDFNFGASFRDSTGRLYFGGSNGYNRFSPKDIATNRSPPKLLITEVTISKDGKPKSFDGIMLKNVQLTHKDYFVQFEFSVLDFMDPEKNQYRYMLEGFDRDWVESGTRNSATYTSLPAGDYTLRVQGANSAGIWNREGLTLSVQVLPAPWLTWWAFSLYALGALLLIWLSTRAYVSFVIERRAMEMAVEMVEAEERADDEMQEQLEIHDDLVKSVYRHSVSTLNLVGELIATKSSYLTDDFACEVVRASINRVDALAILEECLYHKNETLLADLNKYTNILIANLLKKSPVGEENIITINEVSTQPLPIEQASPLAIALFELVENAIQHGFEETGRANYLHIVLAPDEPGLTEQTYRLVVQDNGPGIPPNIDPLAAETSGLAIVSSMARRLSGVLGFSNRNGTSVSIIFPKAEAG